MTATGDARHTLGRILAIWRAAYGAETRRRLAWSIVAVPRALAALPRAARGPGRVRRLTGAVLAVPVALASSALTATLAFLVLINVLAYPFRGWLGMPGRTDDIWASRYADSWGGPTLAGAWATHAGLILLLGVPAVTWAVRGLTGLQWRLTRRRPEGARSSVTSISSPTVDTAVPPRSPVTPTRGGKGPSAARPPAGTLRPARAGRHLHRVAAVLVALALLVTSSLTAHAAGIGDNLLWTPRDAVSSVALAVTLAPVAALLALTRTSWWRVGPRHR